MVDRRRKNCALRPFSLGPVFYVCVWAGGAISPAQLLLISLCFCSVQRDSSVACTESKGASFSAPAQLSQLLNTMRSLMGPNLPAATRTPICAQRGPARVPFCTTGPGAAAAAAAAPTRAGSSHTPRATIHSMHSPMHSPHSSNTNNLSSRAGATAAATSSNAAAAAAGPASTSFVSLTELKELCSKALSTIGYTKDEIAVLLEVGACAMPRPCFGRNCRRTTLSPSAAAAAGRQYNSNAAALHCGLCLLACFQHFSIAPARFQQRIVLAVSPASPQTCKTLPAICMHA
jgi:hypothetical protein